MGKKILKLLLYMMAVVGVLIWLDSTEGLTGIDYFCHFIIGVFCDETDRLFDKETQNKKRKSTESQKKT